VLKILEEQKQEKCRFQNVNRHWQDKNMVREVPITQSRLSINARVQETGGPTGGARLSQNIARELRQRRDQYQEQAIENAYLRGQTAISQQMQKIEQEYAFDPDGMTAALDEYSETFLEEVSDPNMAERFRLQITKSGGAAIAQATARRQKVISDQTQLSALQAVDGINKALPNMVSAMTSPDPAVSLSASEAVQEQLLRVEQIANQTDENGQFIFTPDQRFKMVTDLKDQVAFQRAIANPADYKDFLDGSLIVSLPNAGESTMKTGNRLFKDLKRVLGISDAAAAGIVGNLAHESNGFLQLQELDPLVEGSRGGFGFAQWTGSRREAFESWAQQNNLDPSSYEANVGFLVHELKNTSEGSVLTELEGAGDALEATKIFSDKFLRPGIPHMKSRLAWTQKMLTTENEDVDLVNVRQSMSPEMVKLAKSTIESNIRASREADVITQVSNETSLLDVINDQSIPIAERIVRVRQADFAGEISDGFAGEAISLLNSQKSTKEKVPNEEKLATFQRLSDSLANLRVAFGGTVDSVSDEVKLNSENIKQYKAYKLDVIKEVERGAITVAEGKKLLDGVQGAVTEAVEKNRTDPDGFRIQRGVQDPHGMALDKIDNYLKEQGASGDIARKRELFLRFSDNLGEYDEKGNYQVTGEYASSGNTADDEKIITEALTRAIMSMNNKNFVGRIDTNNPPNQFVQKRMSPAELDAQIEALERELGLNDN
jgi:hypothetical protein